MQTWFDSDQYIDTAKDQ